MEVSLVSGVEKAFGRRRRGALVVEGLRLCGAEEASSEKNEKPAGKGLNVLKVRCCSWQKSPVRFAVMLGKDVFVGFRAGDPKELIFGLSGCTSHIQADTDLEQQTTRPPAHSTQSACHYNATAATNGERLSIIL